MNQQQRKFLVEAIDKQYKTERETLNNRRPKEPALNNYLVAAILDGSFKLKTAEAIRSTVLARVRDLGKGDALVENGSRRSWNSRDRDECEDVVVLPAAALFDLPDGYVSAYAKYEEEYKQWQKEMDRLEASINAMRIKVQVGSDKALEALVNQADQLCSMSLTASHKLFLGNGSAP